MKKFFAVFSLVFSFCTFTFALQNNVRSGANLFHDRTSYGAYVREARQARLLSDDERQARQKQIQIQKLEESKKAYWSEERERESAQKTRIEEGFFENMDAQNAAVKTSERFFREDERFGETSDREKNDYQRNRLTYDPLQATKAERNKLRFLNNEYKFFRWNR